MKSLVHVNLEAHRRPGEDRWSLPPWGHELAMGVFPLFIGQERTLSLIGTAFCVSRIGILASAHHNMVESCRREGIEVPRTRGPFAQRDPSVQLRRTSIAVFHQRSTAAGVITGSVWPLETVDSLPPTDLAFAFPKFQTRFPYLQLPITFDLPRVGSIVTCVGYTRADVGSDTLDLDVFESGQLDVGRDYSHTFYVVQGKVREIFVHRFANGFLDGPCFSIEADVPHGLSGGPVFTIDGAVCGVVSAGATQFFGKPTTLVSPFYPSLLSEVRFGATLGALRINAKHPIINLIASETLKTDGSEEHLSIAREDGELVVCPRVHREDRAYVFEDFDSYQSGKLAAPIVGEVFRLRRTERPEEPPAG